MSGLELGIESHVRSFAPGTTLYFAGAPADVVFLIREGRVRLLKRGRGIERTVDVLGAGDLFGEEALLSGAHRSATAEALEAVTALVVDGDTFRALTRRRPEVGDGVIVQLVHRLRRTEARLEAATVPDPMLRVLDALLLELERSPGGALSLSPLELSSRTGLDPDVVKTVVGSLRDRGYLTLGEHALAVAEVGPLRGLRDLLALKDEVRHRIDRR
jgi:CRP-like cAMP-binding protein